MKKNKIKILLVEDIKIAQVITKLLLEQMHYEVAIAETGTDAISLADKNSYDYIFMDLGLSVSGKSNPVLTFMERYDFC